MRKKNLTRLLLVFITASSSADENSVDTMYVSAESKLHKSNEIYVTEKELEKKNIINPADLFKGIPGVLSGESRSSGAIDVNIRGVQGQGRVITSVDDTINQTALYRGYQGVSNRTYIDPDFISAIDIKKGFSDDPGITGSGGTVNMRTVSPSDILNPGSKFGVRLKGSLLSNHSSYKQYDWNDSPSPKKQNIFDAENRTGNIIFAYSDDKHEFLAGLSKRIRGNYHSGKRGGVNTNPQLPGYLCFENIPECKAKARTIQDAAYTIYPKGHAVPNTSEDTTSYLLKASKIINEEHTLSAVYGFYGSSFGETYVADTTNISQGTTVPVTQGPNAHIQLARYKIGYDWAPTDDLIDLIDLHSSLWHVDYKDRPKTSQNTLGDKKETKNWGGNLYNKSSFYMGKNITNLVYGGSFVSEKTGPSKGYWTQNPHQREGSREEYRYFIKASHELANNLNLLASIENKKYHLKDTGDNPSNNKSGSAFGFSFGTEYKPIEQIMMYGRYSSTPRFPSLVEGTNGFLMKASPNLHHETMKSIEIGSSVQVKNILKNDQLDFEVGYFNSTIDNYLSRSWQWSEFSMIINNINKAKFEGIELGTTYSINNFKARVAANYYIDISFCKEKHDCKSENLPSDYATNHIPPKKSYSLDVNQTFLNGDLSIGGTVKYYDRRAIPTAKVSNGSAPLLAPVDYKPATTLDFNSSYALNKNLSIEFNIDNVTDVYYIEPVNVGYIPSPGRTFKLGFTAIF